MPMSPRCFLEKGPLSLPLALFPRADYRKIRDQSVYPWLSGQCPHPETHNHVTCMSLRLQAKPRFLKERVFRDIGISSMRGLFD